MKYALLKEICGEKSDKLLTKEFNRRFFPPSSLVSSELSFFSNEDQLRWTWFWLAALEFRRYDERLGDFVASRL
jgi:hypothetical protein